jgi:hypothetical protein
VTCHNPIAAGPTDNYYGPQGVRNYAAVTCKALHSYLIEGLSYWYELYPPPQEGGWTDHVDKADAPDEENVRALSCADTVPPPSTFNMVFRSAAAKKQRGQDRLGKSHDIRHDIRKDTRTRYRADIVCSDIRMVPIAGWSQYPYILISCPISGLILWPDIGYFPASGNT